MATQIQFKRGSSASLEIVNPVLAAGEPGFETDTGKFKIGDGTTAWNSLPYAAGLPTHTHAVSDVTNLQTTLDAKLADAPTDGGTYARKSGDWVDVAQASNLQLRRGTEAERVQITPLEGEPIYTTDSKKLYIGDGQTVGGNEIVSGEKAPQLNPPGMARMVTIRDGLFTAVVSSSTGYIAVRWWDGSVDVFGAGVATDRVFCQKGVPTTGSWIKSAPKEIFIWSCTAGNAQQSGVLTRLEVGGQSLTALDIFGLTALTYLSCGNNPFTDTSLDVSSLTALTELHCGLSALTSLNVSGLTSLTELHCSNNSLTSLNVSGCTALTELWCYDNSLTSLDVSSLTALTYLACNENSLTSLNVSGCTALTNLYCDNNSLTSLDVSGLTALTTLHCYDNSLISLDVSSLTAMTTLWCYNNSLTSLNVSGCTALTNLLCNDNSLTSLRAVGVPGAAYYASNASYTGPYYDGVRATNNSLDAAALDQLYADLADNTLSAGYALIFVDGNPGTTGDNPTIATAKNWVVLGS